MSPELGQCDAGANTATRTQGYTRQEGCDLVQTYRTALNTPASLIVPFVTYFFNYTFVLLEV